MIKDPAFVALLPTPQKKLKLTELLGHLDKLNLGHQVPAA